MNMRAYKASQNSSQCFGRCLRQGVADRGGALHAQDLLLSRRNDAILHRGQF